MAAETPPPARLKDVPRSIWALGFVSLFMDVSSEMIHALLPLYLVGVLGASVLTVGLMEGVAEAIALGTRIFSGALSDWLGKRKLLAVIGYGLAAITKPVFPLATGIGWLFAARFVDRLGKGIRGAPRDALIADLAPAHLRGASFGLRQSLDTVGATIGPFLAIALMTLTGDAFTVVFWIAVIPAFIALGLLVVGVREPVRSVAQPVRAPLRLADMKRLAAPFWAVVAAASVLTLARFSEAFLILRAYDLGLPLALAPAIMVVMNVFYALAAYPAGALSDRRGRTGVMAAGVGCLVAADLLLATGGSLIAALAGVAMWGLHMGMTQGLLAAMVADTAPAALRGTAFGLLNLAAGAAMLAASVIAGALWETLGPSATFLAGAGFSTIALIGLLAAQTRPGPAHRS